MDARVEHASAEHAPDLRQDLLGVTRAAVVQSRQDAKDIQLRVEPPLDLMQGIQQHAQTPHGKVFALQGMMTPWHATNALTVNRPRLGGQSTMTKS